ncbi:MAG: hypothetical protein AAFU67_02200 [Bacteroidota bacterium]
MKQLLLALTILSTCPVFGQSSHPNGDAQIKVGPMNLTWTYEDEYIVFTVQSPDMGWVVLGINDRDDIVGATLYSGGYRTGAGTYFSERLVTSLGKNQSLKELGLTERVTDFAVEENSSKGTKLKIRMPYHAKGGKEYDLSKGQEHWIILAYSVSDDADHHSRFRKHVKVKL